MNRNRLIILLNIISVACYITAICCFHYFTKHLLIAIGGGFGLAFMYLASRCAPKWYWVVGYVVNILMLVVGIVGMIFGMR